MVASLLIVNLGNFANISVLGFVFGKSLYLLNITIQQTVTKTALAAETAAIIAIRVLSTEA